MAERKFAVPSTRTCIWFACVYQPLDTSSHAEFSPEAIVKSRLMHLQGHLYYERYFKSFVSRSHSPHVVTVLLKLCALVTEGSPSKHVKFIVVG